MPEEALSVRRVILAAFACHWGNRVGERRIDSWMKPAAPADEYSSFQVCCGEPATTASAMTATTGMTTAKSNLLPY
nr:hypothetical protein [Candidatus Njordarchaeota archaeon]